MTTVVGIDLSLTSTGLVAAHSPSDFQTMIVGERGHAHDSVATTATRITALADRIAQWIPSCDLVVIEGPSYRSVSTSVWERAGAWYRVVCDLTARSIPVAVAPPASTKLWLTGHGGSGKAAMMAAASHYSGVNLSQNDIADAYALAMMGLDYLCGLGTESHQAVALMGVAWPER